MPTLLSDPPPILYLLLIVGAIVGVCFAYSKQDRRAFRIAGITVGLLLLVFLLDLFFESPREEATRKVQAMAAAATAANGDGFVEHVSPTFAVGPANREKLRTTVSSGIVKQLGARVAVWDFGHDTFQWISDGEIEIGFMSKGEAANGFVMRYTRTRFVRDPDGQWRLKDVKFYNPADRGLNVEEPIPGFP